jgi:hypothetical protein
MNILVLGDSHTYGEELSDLTHAWPNRLAEKLKCTIVNLARPGGSNPMMVRLAVESTIDTRYDMVLIGWSDWSRFELADGNFNHSFTSPVWICNYYRESYNDAFAFKNWLIQIIMLQDYFKNKQQPYKFFNTTSIAGVATRYQLTAGKLYDLIDKEHFLGWPSEGLLTWTDGAPRAPGGHTLNLGHERIANEIAKHIRN